MHTRRSRELRSVKGLVWAPPKTLLTISAANTQSQWPTAAMTKPTNAIRAREVQKSKSRPSRRRHGGQAHRCTGRPLQGSRLADSTPGTIHGGEDARAGWSVFG